MTGSTIRFVTIAALGTLLGVGTLSAPPLAQAEVTQDPPEKVMTMMIEAAKTKSYQDFIVEVDDGFRAALTPQMFEGVANQLSPRLRLGYKTKYLTKLRQQGNVVYLWKLEFTDGKDEALIKMAVKDKKIGLSAAVASSGRQRARSGPRCLLGGQAAQADGNHQPGQGQQGQAEIRQALASHTPFMAMRCHLSFGAGMRATALKHLATPEVEADQRRQQGGDADRVQRGQAQLVGTAHEQDGAQQGRTPEQEDEPHPDPAIAHEVWHRCPFVGACRWEPLAPLRAVTVKRGPGPAVTKLFLVTVVRPPGCEGRGVHCGGRSRRRFATTQLRSMPPIWPTSRACLPSWRVCWAGGIWPTI